MLNHICGILPANLILIFIGMLDLISTIYWVETGRAVEMNPIMSALLNFGLLPFILAKVTSLGIFVYVVEWYRRRRSETFARAVSFFTIAAYLFVYTVSFFFVNFSFFFG